MKNSVNNSAYKRYLLWGITVFCVIAASIILFFVLYRMRGVSDAVRNILRILMPIIYGGVLAYVLNPIYRRVEHGVTGFFTPRLLQKPRRALTIGRLCGTLACLFMTFFLLWGVYKILPQLVQSIFGIAQRLPGQIMDVERWLRQVVEENDGLGPVTLEMYQSTTDYLQQWINSELIPYLSNWIGVISSSVMGVITLVMNFFIGIIVMVYLLNGKRNFAGQGKKIIYSLWSVDRANLVIENLRYTHHVFSGFISGKLLDSLIIGVITFFFMTLTGMPNNILIATIIGVTNIIPFFGPFLGAIPSMILLLFESPLLCLYFGIFILVLQQVDGNIIGPKILGDSTGLPSFWVLFSILLLGGLFGFVGMVLAVPLFALLYSLIAALVNRRLEERDLPTATEPYQELHHVDPVSLNLVQTIRYRGLSAPVTKVKIDVDNAPPRKKVNNKPEADAEPTEPEE